MTAAPVLELDDAIRLCCILLGIGQAAAAGEMFFMHRTGRLEAFLPWRIVKLRSGAGMRRPPIGSILDSVYSARSMQAMAVIRLACAIALIVVPLSNPFVFTSLAIVLAVIVLDSYRNPMGGEGADQMYTILTVSLLVATFPGAPVVIRQIALIFVAAQALLSYATSGVSKLVSPIWRSGDALPGILSTWDYGIPAVGHYLSRHPAIARSLAWGTIVFECGFLLAFVNPWASVVMVTLGLGFHAGVAATMGLNAFLIAFPATYPAVYWLSQWNL